MTAPHGLRAIPTEDRAWLMAGLADALAGGAPIVPVAPGTDPDAIASLQQQELPEGTAVVVRTSGSSGTPKAVALSADALRASAEATAERFGGHGQWLVTLPPHLISGLQMLVRSELAGTQPVFFDGHFDPAAFLERAETLDAERRYVSLVPVQLARLFDMIETDRAAADVLRRFDAVLVGGQAVSLALRSRAHALGIGLKRSYGMTETAGGCVYDGVEIGDTRVRIRGGEVQLAGPSLALGYVGDAELTDRAFITEAGRDGVPVRWYRTGDSGELLGGMLTVTGRIDRVIISGGVNVSLDEVERVVRDQTGWESAVALSAPHPEWGERVSLVVEIDRSADPTRRPKHAAVAPRDARVSFERVQEALRGALGPASVPEWATEMEEIPRLSGGKPDHAAIKQWMGRLRASFSEVRRGDDQA
ncbi:AMP-binding protein [Leucobacter musarum]|uniref:AMP-binding protein n=1 Tax=Leucobacter musarum TaxID=1930747 RepID=UPI000AA2452E|nr:AMP-binding protein [Leucobacter musarum]